jgi:hypothetical protein
MIVVLAVLFRLLLRDRLLNDARQQAERGLAGAMEGHAAMDMSISRQGSFARRLFSREGFTSVSQPHPGPGQRDDPERGHHVELHHLAEHRVLDLGCRAARPVLLDRWGRDAQDDGRCARARGHSGRACASRHAPARPGCVRPRWQARRTAPSSSGLNTLRG